MKPYSSSHSLSKSRKRTTVLCMVLGLLLAAAVLGPVIWMFLTALKLVKKTSAADSLLIHPEICPGTDYDNADRQNWQ